jgi:hypothetical protein
MTWDEGLDKDGIAYKVAAPLAFSFLIDLMGGRVLMVSSALSLSALFALCLLKAKPLAHEMRIE